MNSKLKLFALWLGASAIVGWIAEPFARPAREAGGDRFVSDRESLASIQSGLGQGLSIAALGGYRVIAANFVWISMYGDWQYRRAAPVLEKMSLAVALNPHSEYFWVDGSRIIANDMPVWEVGDNKMGSLFETETGEAVRHAYAERALRFLEDAPAELGASVPLLVEKGSICWRRLGDLERAIGFFAQAVARENVPYYVCRVYAELLYRNGQARDAYEYLASHYADLPDDDLRARKQMVKRRLEELRGELEDSP